MLLHRLGSLVIRTRNLQSSSSEGNSVKPCGGPEQKQIFPRVYSKPYEYTYSWTEGTNDGLTAG